jgi:hypothetical protein
LQMLSLQVNFGGQTSALLKRYHVRGLTPARLKCENGGGHGLSSFLYVYQRKTENRNAMNE